MVCDYSSCHRLIAPPNIIGCFFESVPAKGIWCIQLWSIQTPSNLFTMIWIDAIVLGHCHPIETDTFYKLSVCFVLFFRILSHES